MKKVLLILFILSICFVSSTHTSTISTGASSYSKTQGQSLIYNISITNTGIGTNASITQVEIILPNSFTFKLLSQGTTAASTDFTKTGQKLIWEDLENYLINQSETKRFWFKAEASLTGNYSLAITTTSAEDTDESSIEVKVTPAETSDCTPNWNCSEWSSCTNSTQTRNCTDSNICNNETNKPIESQSCTIPCTPNWTCSEWSECKNSTQTKTCTDLNICNTTQGKPITTNNCIQEKTSWLFIIIITIIILGIIVGTIYLIKTLRNSNQQNFEQPPASKPL